MDITKQCLIANMKRVVQILESDIKLDDYWDSYKVRAELKHKMHEIRRDSKKLHDKI